MENNFKVGCSPLTNKLYAGRVSKNNVWVGNKHDVTQSAVSAVAQHLIQSQESVMFTYKDERYILKVEKIEKIK